MIDMQAERFNVHRPVKRIRVTDWVRVNYELHGPYCGGCSRHHGGQLVNVPWPCHRVKQP